MLPRPPVARAVGPAPVRAGLGALALAMVTLLAPGAAVAQFKVIGPDKSVTYTDRPPTDGRSVVRPMGQRTVDLNVPLPPELAPVVSKYPVTLYTTASCPPCDSGRAALRQRGVPFSERLVVNDDDTQALQRLTGTTSLPVLSIGTQILRGLALDEWTDYLDAAGYPKSSRLPKAYEYAAASPLAERKAPPAPPVSVDAPPLASDPMNNPAGIRF